MKTPVYLFAFFLFILTGHSQSQSLQVQQPDTADYPYWISMMQDPSANFFDVQKAFNTYWENRKVEKGSGFKPFKRWEWWMQNHINPDGSRMPSDHIWKEYHKYLDTHPGAKNKAGAWISLGPMHIPSGDKGYKGLGRINTVAFHPTDPGIIYIGAPAGGIWSTSDGGDNWVSYSDNLPTLGVSSILVDYSNPQVLYIGTGDRDAGDAAGVGVMKSLDGGMTWSPASNGMDNKTVGRMIMHPADNEIILAATSGGIYRSTDAATNWVLVKSGNYKDIVFKPGNPDIIYAASGGNFFKSTDNGLNWQQITNGLPGGSRAVIGVTPAAPDYVYFLITNGDSFKGLYRSENEGESFTMKSNSPNIMSWGCEGGDGGQAWYDLDVAVDPVDPDILYAGGVNCFKSSDGGITWDISSHWWGDCGVPSVHADLHGLEWNPADGRLYATNDGGIYWTDNGGTNWIEITDGLTISQVYRIGQAKTQKNKVVNGYQDNGSSTYMGNDWIAVLGGDGMECAVDHTNPAISYGTIYYGDIFRLNNNNNEYQVGGEGNHGITESGGWITPFCLHETNNNVMFAGYKNIWRSDNILGTNFQWKQLSTGGGSDISVIEHSAANTGMLYYARGAQVYRTDEAMEDQPEWINLNGNLPGSGNILDIESSPLDENLVFVSRGSKIFKSENKGNSWTDISGSLPQINMNSLAFYMNSNNGLYAGTDAGVFYKDDDMADWIMFSDGLPVDASINEIEIYHNPANPAEDEIRAGTYGRGMWSSPMYQTAPDADFIADQTNVPQDCPVNFTDLSSGVPTSWLWSFEGGYPATSTEKNPQNITFSQVGTFDVSLTVTNSGGSDTKLIPDYITVGATTAPNVYFVASDSISCTGTGIAFTDMTTGCPASWTWSFTPNTVTFINGTNQNSQNPEVEFNNSGTYSVSLTAANGAGSNTLIKEGYIHIGGMNLPFSDDFESGSLSTKSWRVENPDYSITWDINDVGGITPGDKAAWLNFYDYIVPPGRRDRLITPILNFTDHYFVYLYFDHAYAKRHSSVTDSLIVYVSDDCGENWTRIFEGGENGSGNFATHELMADPFIPQTEDDWCGTGGFGPDCITLDLSQWGNQENIQVAFETFNYFGNNLFIDNVNVFFTTSIPANDQATGVRIYPNPANDKVYVYSPGLQVMEACVTDITGRKVLSTEMTGSIPGTFTLDISDLREGIYILKLVHSSGVYSSRLIVR